jgi:uncharacterized repeat protein (TIGR01451 family)
VSKDAQERYTMTVHPWAYAVRRRHHSAAAKPVIERLEERQLLAFAAGDLLIGVNSGIQWRHSDGSLVMTLPSSALDNAGMALAKNGDLYVTGFEANKVNRYSTTGASLGTFGSGYNSDPESIVFDALGNAYVGQADGTHEVLKFDSSGNLIASYPVQIESRGSDWVELAADQHTLYYTSEGHTIKRYDLAMSKQLPDFATGLPGDEAFQLRLLPDGSLLVADNQSILHLDSTGKIIQTYGYAPDNQWFALTLAPDGKSFWSADQGNGTVAKFDIASGKLLESFVASPSGVDGLVAVAEIQPATAAALSLIPVIAPAETTVGNTTTYAMLAINQGPASATGLTITATLPVGATFVTGGSSLGIAPTIQNGVATFQLGDLAPGAAVEIAVLERPDIAGTLVVSATASSTTPNTTPAAAAVTLTTSVSSSDPPPVIDPPAAAQPPVVLATPTIKLNRARPHQIKSYITIVFSQDMNLSLAQNLRNYQIHGPMRTNRLKTRNVRTIPIRTATYESATRSVVLGSIYRLNPRQVYQLTVSAGPGGLASNAGIALAGQAGQPGTDYTAVLK